MRRSKLRRVLKYSICILVIIRGASLLHKKLRDVRILHMHGSSHRSVAAGIESIRSAPDVVGNVITSNTSSTFLREYYTDSMNMNTGFEGTLKHSSENYNIQFQSLLEEEGYDWNEADSATSNYWDYERDVQALDDDNTDDRHGKRPENNNSTNGPAYIFTTIPSRAPSSQPSHSPSKAPSYNPSSHPSASPTYFPSSSPTVLPTFEPSNTPSGLPSSEPTFYPSSQPSIRPSITPTSKPSELPSIIPTFQPSSPPSNVPTLHPSFHPTIEPSFDPTSVPSSLPTNHPSLEPSTLPSYSPTQSPSSQPSKIPSHTPSTLPTNTPSTTPSSFPTLDPCLGRNGSFGLTTTNSTEKLYVYYKYSIETDNEIQYAMSATVGELVSAVEYDLLNELVALYFPLCEKDRRRRIERKYNEGHNDENTTAASIKSVPNRNVFE